MAVPTFTSVTPAAGLTKGGSLVRIVGTGFRVPPSPPVLGYVGGAAQRTVSVTFGGLACRQADAVSATLIACRPAPWAGDYDTLPAALDVRVANLDDAGVEIPTENVTAVAAYTVAPPPLTTEYALQRAVRAVLQAFRRYLLVNTHLAMSRDYDGTLGAPDRVVADLPAVILGGPILRVDRTDPRAHLPAAADADDPPYGWTQVAAPLRVDLEFDVRLRGGSAAQAFGLQQSLWTLMRDVPLLTVDGVTCEFMGLFDRDSSVIATLNGADVYEIRTFVVLKRVQLIDETDMLQIEASGRTIWADDGLPTLVVQPL